VATLLSLGLYSFLIAFALTPLLRIICHRLGLVDRPDGDRKIHTKPIPRVGGIAIVAAYCGAFLPILLSHSAEQRAALSDNLHLIAALAPAAGVVFLTGLVDDIFHLKPWQKLLGQFAAAAMAYWAGVRIENIGSFELSYLSAPLTLVWIVGCSNAFNLIDGLDGLAVGAGLCATAAMAAAALMTDNAPLLMATAPLLGGLLAFLCYNFNPASIFLGDCGSLLIGFCLGCFGVVWGQKTTTAVGMTAPLMALALPVLDAGLAIMRRYLRRQPIFSADRGHIHHKLLALGCGPRHAALILYGVCGISAALSLLQGALYRSMGSAVVLVFCVLVFIGVRRLRYVEFAVIQKMVGKGELRKIPASRIPLQVLDDALDKIDRETGMVAPERLGKEELT